MTEYSLSDLCDLADVTPRTVRYYMAQGLLPKPTGFGPGAHYSGEHLSRLRLIRRLRREHLPLGEIRRRLEGVRDEDIERLASAPGTPSISTPVSGSALDYVRGLLAGEALESTVAARVRLDELASTMPLQTLPRAAQSLMHRPASGPALAPRAEIPGLTPPDRGDPGPEARPDARPTIDRSQWDRIALSPDVEVHVRRPLSRDQNRQVDRLLEAGRQIFEKEPR